MNPKNYFPKIYMEDFNVYPNKQENALNGPSGMVCGMTLEDIFHQDNRCNYHSIEDFICCLYELNLINQGIHYYFIEDFGLWCKNAVPFPASNVCVTNHGGVHTPYSIIENVERFTEAYEFMDAVEFKEGMLMEYTQYFFQDYLSRIVKNNRLSTVTPDKLIKQLKNDHDCSEINIYLK